ncbi:MAG: hypothetical protein PVG20_05875, partial [Thioalkalispiraceae bacterium]
MKKSTKLGSLISPLVPPMLWIMYFVISPNPDYEKNGSLEMSFAIFSIVIIFWYFISFMLGAIILKLLQKLNKLTVFWLVVTSTVLGAGVFSIFAFLLLKSGEILTWKDYAFILGVGGLFGFITSSVFCALSGITRRATGRQT